MTRRSLFSSIAALFTAKPAAKAVTGIIGAPKITRGTLSASYIGDCIDNIFAHNEIIQKWLESDDGHTARKTNPQGYANVAAMLLPTREIT